MSVSSCFSQRLTNQALTTVSSKNTSTLPCAAIQKLKFQSRILKSSARAKKIQPKLTTAQINSKKAISHLIFRRKAVQVGADMVGEQRNEAVDGFIMETDGLGITREEVRYFTE